MNKRQAWTATIGMLAATTASAAVHTYQFGGAVINGTGMTPASSFASLSINDVTDQFTLSLANLQALGLGANANVTDLAVSYDGSVPTISGVSGGTVVTTSKSQKPDGEFDFGFVFNSGSNLLTSQETVSWTAKGFNFSQLQSGELGKFALRVKGPGQKSDGNGWYGVISSVPEPDSTMMLLSGLALISLISVRSKSQV